MFFILCINFNMLFSKFHTTSFHSFHSWTQMTLSYLLLLFSEKQTKKQRNKKSKTITK